MVKNTGINEDANAGFLCFDATLRSSCSDKQFKVLNPFGDGRWPGIDHVLYHMSKCEKDVGNYQSPGVKGEITVSCSGDC